LCFLCFFVAKKETGNAAKHRPFGYANNKLLAIRRLVPCAGAEPCGIPDTAR
jgi:hypothetical protein